MDSVIRGIGFGRLGPVAAGLAAAAVFDATGADEGADGALDNMIWRLYVDLDFDGATHEYMHTVKGNGVKANQGWNAAIYAIWEELIRRGVGDKRFFDAAEEKLRGIE